MTDHNTFDTHKLLNTSKILHNTIETLTAENTSVATSNTNLTADIASLTAANASLTAENTSVATSNTNLTADIASLTAANASLTETNTSLTTAVNKKSTECTAEQNKLDTIISEQNTQLIELSFLLYL